MNEDTAAAPSPNQNVAGTGAEAESDSTAIKWEESWYKVEYDLGAVAQEINASILLFRGHADADWKLLPTFARRKYRLHERDPKMDLAWNEYTIYGHFVVGAGDLLPPNEDVWHNVFAMQHHGVPTRLLDWSTSFAIAVFFAMRDANATAPAAVWVLNPFLLNSTHYYGSVPRPNDLPGTYYDYFMAPARTRIPFPGPALAVYPPRFVPRAMSQQSGFTIHADVEHPLEELAPHAVRKIVIPPTAFDGARNFLRMAGLSEFTVFRDLDALGREITKRFF